MADPTAPRLLNFIPDREKMRLLVTGGAGFIGSNFIHMLMNRSELTEILNIDALSYASDLSHLKYDSFRRYTFEKVDLCNRSLVNKTVYDFQPTHVVHFAAESHVDRSLDDAVPFIQSNIEGTYNLIDACRKSVPYLERFIHISTDEVFGSIDVDSTDEHAPYAPRNPYAASKAGAEHIVSSFVDSFEFPAVITRCTNNYGPYQHHEKFVPKSIDNLMHGRDITVHGNGSHVREWIHVNDHCHAIYCILQAKDIRRFYNVTGGTQATNLEIATMLCELFGVDAKTNIVHVANRIGNDQRYSLASKYIHETGYKAQIDLAQGLKQTMHYYRNIRT